MGCGSSAPYAFDDSMCYRESIKVVEEKLEAEKGGWKVHLCSWIKTGGEVKGVVVICHGLFEHGLRFHKIASQLAELGYAVYAQDHCWHGRTTLEGEERGIIRDHTAILDSFVKVTELVSARHTAGLPRFCVAHSMGTMITLNTHQRLDWQGVVFSGTATVAGPGGASPFGCRCLFPLSKAETVLACVLSCMSALDPKGPVSPILPRDLMEDPDGLDAVARDPHRFHGWLCNITAREIAHLLQGAKNPSSLSSFKRPFTAIHGSNDSICLPASAQMLIDQTSTPADQKHQIVIEGMMHECLKDPMDGSYPGVKAAVEAIENMFDARAVQPIEKKVEVEAEKKVKEGEAKVMGAAVAESDVSV